jgi:hypothetical protein
MTKRVLLAMFVLFCRLKNDSRMVELWADTSVRNFLVPLPDVDGEVQFLAYQEELKETSMVLDALVA